MNERALRFREAISGFIEERRAAKEKEAAKNEKQGKKNNYNPGEFVYRVWLQSATKKAPRISLATHVLKATHPDARGSNPYVIPSTLPFRQEIGSHVLGEDFVEDVACDAAVLDVVSFLQTEVEGRRLLDWMQAADADLKTALSDDPAEAEAWMTAFSSLVREEEEPASHPMAKQVYWLVGDNPRDDGHYHLLQPMFSSSLAHAVHADIESARFGEENVEARKAFRENHPSEATYRDYRGLAYRKLGGTKPQNISQLNRERGGINYLLPSLPPPAWKPRGLRLLKSPSAFGELVRFGNVRQMLDELAAFLAGDPQPTMETRQRRQAMEQALGQELALFGAAVRAQLEPGWTRDPQCGLPRHQQLWLDPDRTLLEVRDDPEHPEWQADDEAFNREYALGEWPDQVAADFGRWLNQQLRNRNPRLAALGEEEMRHFARQALLDVAWPVPMQRRAAAGGEA